MTRALVFCCLIAVVLAANENCFYKGKKYKTGFIFFSGCNACICLKDNTISCNLQACQYYGVVRYKSQTCTRNQKIYRKGEIFRVGQCKKCTCKKNNKISCKRKSCNRKGCFHKGIYHKPGTQISFGCIVCRCSLQGTKCTAKKCFL